MAEQPNGPKKKWGKTYKPKKHPHPPVKMPEWLGEPMPQELTQEDLPLLPIEDKDVLTAYRALRVKRLLLEKARRQIEGLKLYEPLDHLKAFHADKTPERLIRGSNRAAKTMASCIEVARAVLGVDPYEKYPKRDGICYIVGFDGRQVSRVLYRYLFRAGAFKIIRDLETHEWRVFKPWLEPEREKDAKPVPPLIPMRYVQGGNNGISWENKKENLPSLIRLITGWEIHFFTSGGIPPRGTECDIALFSEEIENREWYPEIAARLSMRHGKFIWEATPQSAGEQLLELHDRAESEDEQALPPDERTAVEYFCFVEDNPYFTEERRKLLFAKFTEEERRVRYFGEFARSGYRVYPEFSRGVHGCEPFPIPADWCRYVAIDPGRQVCAALFAAVPPPDDPHGDHVYMYDELYLRNCDAAMFGERMAQRCEGQSFEAFVIDHQWSRIADTGSGRQVEVQYEEALAKHHVMSRRSGSGFLWGSTDVKGGIEAVRSWLRVRDDASPRLRFFLNSLPNFEKEMAHYHYKKVKEEVTDEPVKKRDHTVDCARYLALLGLKWVPPLKIRKRKSEVMRYIENKKKRARQNQDTGDYVRLGPGRA